MIAIIAILAGMLLPALNKARLKAVDISCRSNLKQFSYVYRMYLENANEWLPTHRLKVGHYFYQEFKNLTGTASGQSQAKKFMLCPAASNYANDKTRRASSNGLPDYALNIVGGSNTGVRSVTLHMQTETDVFSSLYRGQGIRPFPVLPYSSLAAGIIKPKIAFFSDLKKYRFRATVTG